MIVSEETNINSIVQKQALFTALTEYSNSSWITQAFVIVIYTEL
jgi:hypothetical protein